MKNLHFKLLSLGIVSLAFSILIGCTKENTEPINSINNIENINNYNSNPEFRTGTSQKIPGKYIVVLNESFQSLTSQARSYEKREEHMRVGIKDFLQKEKIQDVIVERVYHSSIIGFSATLNSAQLEMLKKNSEVRFIEEDQIISLGRYNPGSGYQPEQVIPYGVKIVGTVDGTGKTAWIIDTGVDLRHPDLIVDLSRSKSFIYTGKNSKSPNDEHGHGTHVGGTIAAKNNSIGVIGVAAGATLVAVKVLDHTGSGTVSGVVQGIDYVASQGKTGEVANLSLGGSASSSLDLSVKNAAAKGIMFSIAAGNSAKSAGNYSPARVNATNVYTVSAMDSTKSWAYFSNFGNPPIDYCTPGVSVLSTWKGGTYKRISGTSMAAPHMAGVLLMSNGDLKTNGTVKNDPDGNPDPIPFLGSLNLTSLTD